MVLHDQGPHAGAGSRELISPRRNVVGKVAAAFIGFDRNLPVRAGVTNLYGRARDHSARCIRYVAGKCGKTCLGHQNRREDKEDAHHVRLAPDRHAEPHGRVEEEQSGGDEARLHAHSEPPQYQIDQRAVGEPEQYVDSLDHVVKVAVA